MKATFKDRLLKAMELRNITASELAIKSGLSKPQISQYTKGIYEPKQKGLYKLAIALNVNESWLMGHNVPMERNLEKKGELTKTETQVITAYRNTTDKNKQLIHTILEIEEYQFQPTMIKRAARNGIPGEHEIPKEKAEEAKNFPDVTDDI